VSDVHPGIRVNHDGPVLTLTLANPESRNAQTPSLWLALAQVGESLRMEGSELASERIGLTVLERLRALDEVAYLRFASVYKGFDDPSDFEREAGLLAHRPPVPPG